MAEDLTLNHGSGTAVTISLDSLADGADVAATAFDMGATSELLLGLEVILDGDSASNTGAVYLYAAWSHDNTDFSTVDGTTPTTAVNDELIAAITMNGTTVVKKIFSTPVQARYCQLRAYNDSGDALLSSGNSITRYPIAIDQA